MRRSIIKYLVIVVLFILAMSFSSNDGIVHNTINLQKEAPVYETGTEVVLEFSSTSAANSIKSAFSKYVITVEDNKIIMSAEEAAKVELLSISGYSISTATNFVQFLKLPNLKTLSISNTTHLSNLEDIAQLTHIESLSLGSIGLYDASFLSTMTNLKVLRFTYGNYVTDFSPINSLTQLEELSFYENDDLSSLNFSSFTNLKKLEIQRSETTVFPDITNITTLTELNMYFTNITTVPDLSNLVNLTSLLLNYNKIDTLDGSGLSNLTNLETLSLYGNNLTDVPDLTRLSKLKNLNISSNEISNIDFLRDFEFLEIVSLGGNNISSFENMSNLPALKELHLSSNEITTIPSTISNFQGLTKLSLSSNKLENISNLSTLSNLTSLLLRECEILDVSPLSTLTSLESLDLSYNIIEDMSPLYGLDNLKYLYLYDNRISEFNSLATSTDVWNNISTLDLNNNIITDISEIDNLIDKNTLKGLNWLTLRGNQIEDIENLEAVKESNVDIHSQVFEVYLKDKQDYTLPSWLAKTRDVNSVYYSSRTIDTVGGTISPDYSTITFDQGDVPTTSITMGSFNGAGHYEGVRISFYFDAVAPTYVVNYLEKLDYSNVVKITSDEPLQPMPGWILSKDELTLTKEYFVNTNETIQILDKAGNATDVNFEVTNINTTVLDSLTVDGIDVELLPSVYEYNITVDTYASPVLIEGTTHIDNEILGLGSLDLASGVNNYNITVTNDLGETTIYILNINRPPNDNVYLTDISVNGLSVDGFDKNINDYYLTVPYNTETLTINHEQEYLDQSVTYSSSYSAFSGNTFDFEGNTPYASIEVRSEDASVYNTYRLQFTRENTSKLKDLSIVQKGVVLNFISDQYNYVLEVPDNVHSLDLNYETYFVGTEVTITGNEFIIDGSEIIVTSTYLGEVTTYTFTIDKITPSVSTTEFEDTGTYQTYTAPFSGYYEIELWGSASEPRDDGAMGNGAYTKGTIYLTKGQNIYVYVGNYDQFNGGSRGGSTLLGGINGISSNGGGATDVRLVPGDWDDDTSLNSRIMVAAGAGGSSGGTSADFGEGGHAGGLIGYNGNYNSQFYKNMAHGATQIKGGQLAENISLAGLKTFSTFGKAGYNSATSYLNGSGGGGGGYYGGGGGGGNSSDHGSGGAGGSSFISGHTGSVAITSETDRTPIGCTAGIYFNYCSIHYSGLYFTDTVMIDGAGYNWSNSKEQLTSMPTPDNTYYETGGHTTTGFARITKLEELSNNNFLTDLTVNDVTISNFKPDVYEYDLNLEAEQTSINLKATPFDLDATVSGDGEFSVDTTSKAISISVTALNGDVKTYTVNVIREISEDNSVSLITPSIGTFDKTFDPSIKEYTLEVEDNATLLSFTVNKSSELATLDGHEEKTVLNGTNIRIITITAEDGSKNMYTITVIKKASDATLKSLTVAGYEFDFEPTKLTYDINVSSNKKTMLETEITAVATDSNATVNLMGDINLPGSYKIEVVGRDNYTKTEYTINVDNTNDYYSLTSDAYIVEDGYVYVENIAINDVVNSFDNSKNIRVYKENSLYSPNVSTDMELRIVINNHVYDSAKIIVLGDINGDSEINIIDKILLINHNNSVNNLTDIYLLASDINKDNNVNMDDLNLLDNKIISK